MCHPGEAGLERGGGAAGVGAAPHRHPSASQCEVEPTGVDHRCGPGGREPHGQADRRRIADDHPVEDVGGDEDAGLGIEVHHLGRRERDRVGRGAVVGVHTPVVAAPVGLGLDPHGLGARDLQQQVVRAIGDPLARFHEDKLRLLRAVRFTATFGFRLDPATEQAICSTGHQITQVSVERIAQEMRRMLEHPERALACRLLQQTGLLPAILPELQGLDGSAGSDFTTRLSILQALSVESAEAAWAILLQPLFQPQQADAKRRLSLIHALLRRLKMSNQEIEDIGWLTAHRAALHNLAARPLHDIKPLLHHSCSRLLLAITDAAAHAAGTVSDDSNWARRFLSTQTPDQLNPPPLISGHDVAAAGIPPGPKMRLLLQQIRNAQLDEIIGTHATALQFLQQLITTTNP